MALNKGSVSDGEQKEAHSEASGWLGSKQVCCDVIISFLLFSVIYAAVLVYVKIQNLETFATGGYI